MSVLRKPKKSGFHLAEIPGYEDHSLSSTPSDLDIGVKRERPLTVTPVSLAAEVVLGEILYARDSTYEAEYQLYIMRMAADLLPYERAKQKMILGA
jgi:hypothetical protein